MLVGDGAVVDQDADGERQAAEFSSSRPLPRYWSRQVCIRALPADSPEYLGETVVGNTALPAGPGRQSFSPAGPLKAAGPMKGSARPSPPPHIAPCENRSPLGPAEPSSDQPLMPQSAPRRRAIGAPCAIPRPNVPDRGDVHMHQPIR
jgi:hypothetical protein